MSSSSSSGYSDEDLEASAPSAAAPSASELSHAVELAQICSFCTTFRQPLRLPSFSRTALQEAILGASNGDMTHHCSGDSNERSGVLTFWWSPQVELLAELHFKLAREHPTAKMEKMVQDWEKTLARKLQDNWRKEFTANPMGGGVTYARLTVFERSPRSPDKQEDTTLCDKKATASNEEKTSSKSPGKESPVKIKEDNAGDHTHPSVVAIVGSKKRTIIDDDSSDSDVDLSKETTDKKVESKAASSPPPRKKRKASIENTSNAAALSTDTIKDESMELVSTQLNGTTASQESHGDTQVSKGDAVAKETRPVVSKAGPVPTIVKDLSSPSSKVNAEAKEPSPSTAVPKDSSEETGNTEAKKPEDSASQVTPSGPASTSPTDPAAAPESFDITCESCKKCYDMSSTLDDLRALIESLSGGSLEQDRLRGRLILIMKEQEKQEEERRKQQELAWNILPRRQSSRIAIGRMKNQSTQESDVEDRYSDDDEENRRPGLRSRRSPDGVDDRQKHDRAWRARRRHQGSDDEDVEDEDDELDSNGVTAGNWIDWSLLKVLSATWNGTVSLI
ncbi:hypothetical protein AM588_10010260 [Phytophthora nicotianae]|uniref:Uncharacterized protein n=1 Tax=Phytophthora nicotianae TaxID=4792 RepID=A0A0W8DL98_PHYNI|nr:hypothetical protein AM588_10010260 [Phytophthora nicotianae]